VIDAVQARLPTGFSTRVAGAILDGLAAAARRLS